MNDMERNRQIVQEGLDRRANKRRQKIADAEHEVITIRMFQIINNNAAVADEVQRKAAYDATLAYNAMMAQKANKKRNKRIATLKKHRAISVVNVSVSLLVLTISVVFYAIHLTEILYAIVTAVPAIFTLIFNLCIFVTTQKKLNWRV